MAGTLANVLGLLGLGASLFTVSIGVIFMNKHPKSFPLKWEACGMSNPDEYHLWVDCNSDWQKMWGMDSLPNLQPLLIGAFGAVMHRPVLLQVMGFPKNFLQYGIFMIIQGVVGNLGYCGKLGVINGFFSIIIGIACFYAQTTGSKTDRMVELQGKSPIDCVHDEEGEDNLLKSREFSESDEEDIKDHMGLSALSALFFPPTGIAAAMSSYNVRSAKAKGDLEGARRSRRSAISWMQYSFALGVILIASATTIGLTAGRVAPSDDDDDDAAGDGDGGDGDGDGDGDADGYADGDSEGGIADEDADGVANTAADGTDNAGTDGTDEAATTAGTDDAGSDDAAGDDDATDARRLRFRDRRGFMKVTEDLAVFT